MVDPTWTINTPDDGDITGLYLLGSLYTPIPGEEINARFDMPSKSTFNTFQKYVNAAVDPLIQTGRSAGGVPYYREDLREFSISALSFALEPSQPNGADVWAVLIGGTDQSNEPRNVYRWEFEFTVIADRDAFSSRSDLESARKSTLL
jgi:hypothetical protein